jgi:hypothetical protein
MISFWEACGPYTGQDHQAYKFSNGLLKYEVLLGVPEALIPPKLGRVSSCLFANLHKTASKQRQKMPKNTLKVSLNVIRKTQKNF